MRGHQHHVERKIRFWVVQQERNRLQDGASDRVDAPVDERTQRDRLEAVARGQKR